MIFRDDLQNRMRKLCLLAPNSECCPSPEHPRLAVQILWKLPGNAGAVRVQDFQLPFDVHNLLLRIICCAQRQTHAQEGSDSCSVGMSEDMCAMLLQHLSLRPNT